MTPVLKTEGLTHIYSRGTPFEKVAIDHIDLEINAGEIVGVLGHTGSGKSTFIQHLNALLKPTEGRVLCMGEDINATKASAHNVRFKIGLVFQYPEYQLFEETVFRDIAFGPRNMGIADAELDARVREAAGFAGVPEELFDKSPLELSGGQKRRIAIAGVMAMRPAVLILDEPTAGLDPAGRADILRNIRDYHTRTGATVLLVTHDMDEIAKIARRLIVFRDGSVAMDGTPAQVFGRAGELSRMGLTVPESSVVAVKLKKLGLPVGDGIYTTEQLKNAVLALRRGGEQPRA